jgi:hypothetical protein
MRPFRRVLLDSTSVVVPNRPKERVSQVFGSVPCGTTCPNPQSLFIGGSAKSADGGDRWDKSSDGHPPYHPNEFAVGDPQRSTRTAGVDPLFRGWLIYTIKTSRTPASQQCDYYVNVTHI